MTLTINTKNQRKLRRIKDFLKEIEVDFDEVEDNNDETEYLTSTIANKKHLEDSLREAQKGNVEKIAVEDLWK